MVHLLRRSTASRRLFIPAMVPQRQPVKGDDRFRTTSTGACATDRAMARGARRSITTTTRRRPRAPHGRPRHDSLLTTFETGTRFGPSGRASITSRAPSACKPLCFQLGPPLGLVGHLSEKVGVPQRVQLYSDLPEEVVPVVGRLGRRRVVDVSNGKRDGGVGVHPMDVELRVPRRV